MIFYKVQCGAYLLKVNAEKQAAKIIEKGFKTAIVKEGLYYKVQCGAFSVYENAISQANSIRSYGFNVIISSCAVDEIADDEDNGYIEHHRTRIWAIDFMNENHKLYGNSKAIIEYGVDNKTVRYVVLIDGGMAKGTTVKKLKAAGIKTIDALVLSHGHGDHYGCWSDIFSNFTVKAVYLPDCKQLDKYQKSYGDAIRTQATKAKKVGASVTYMKAGSSFTVGSIICNCVYQLPASAVSEHDGHHFVNNESIVTRFAIDGTWVFHSAGDLQNAGNNALIAHMKKLGQSLKCHIFDIQWHTDGGATNDDICEATSPFVALSNYRDKEGSGRGKVRKRFEKVGALVMRNYEDGDIYIDMVDNVATVTCSKRPDFKKEFTV